jgi:hypothetical protein
MRDITMARYYKHIDYESIDFPLVDELITDVFTRPEATRFLLPTKLGYVDILPTLKNYFSSAEIDELCSSETASFNVDVLRVKLFDDVLKRVESKLSSYNIVTPETAIKELEQDVVLAFFSQLRQGKLSFDDIFKA